MEYTNKINLLNLNLAELEGFLVENGMKKFVAKQIFSWLHEKMIRNFDEMLNISKANREILREKSYIPLFDLIKHQVSKRDKTEKFLFKLEDGNTIETVLLRHKDRNTLCVSSQVGCPLRCEFCATGLDGFVRNLNVNEILNQVYIVNRRLVKKGTNITNIVFMGMGEPLLNLNNVLKSIDLISDEKGINISKRRITISTAGVVPGIEELMKEKSQMELAISLHAVTEEKRSYIMPINRKYPLQDLFTTLENYQKESKRRISFEYILIDDFNNTLKDADLLADFMHSFDHILNLIPYNPTEAGDENYKAPPKEKVEGFYKYLKETRKVNVTVRSEKGRDIDGACGQLRRKK